MPFNYNDKRPVYAQLADELRQQIRSEYKPHDKLLSEREIMKRYSVSRNTVREALSDLESIGYIYRKHGKGTFVNAFDTSTKIGDEYSFTEQMKSLGKKPSTKILEMSKHHVGKYLSTKLQIPAGSEIIKLRRLRLADDLPMMIGETYFPVSKFGSLKRVELEEKQRSLYSVFLEDFGEKVKVADESLSVGMISDENAELLQVPTNSPGFMLRRTTYNQKMEVLEYSVSMARGDQFVYNIQYKNR